MGRQEQDTDVGSGALPATGRSDGGPRNEALSGEGHREAMASMIYDSGCYATRRMDAIEAIESVGRLEDIGEVLIGILDAQRRRERLYTSTNTVEYKVGCEGLIYSCESNQLIRMKALYAIWRIASPHARMEPSPIRGRDGAALVNCALLDGCPNARTSAARIIARCGDKGTVARLFGNMQKMPEAEDARLKGRGKAAFEAIVKEMIEGRLRGTVLKQMLGFAGSSEEIWGMARRGVLNIYRKKDEETKEEMWKFLDWEIVKILGMRGRAWKRRGNRASSEMERLVELQHKLAPTTSNRSVRMGVERPWHKWPWRAGAATVPASRKQTATVSGKKR